MTLVVLSPTGIFDTFAAEKLLVEIQRVLDGTAQTILIDYSEVSFIDTVGLGKLVRILKLVRRAGKNLELCGLNHSLKMVLSLTELDQVFTIHSHHDELLPQTA